MKKLFTHLLLVAIIGSAALSCSKKAAEVPVPIAPIIKETVFPNENDAMPGKVTTIRGKGFATGDKVFIENASAAVEVDVTGVTNDYLQFMIPRDAGGTYVVNVERAGKQTTLDGELTVPFVIPLDDVVMPTDNFQAGAAVTIPGKGFESGDVIQLTADFYPQDKVISINGNATADGITFTLPAGSYGVNNVIVTRTNRKTSLGSINIQVNVGDAVGGGIVFWTDAAKIHGLIVNKTNTGTPTEQFGPGVALSGAAGTSKAIGSGKDNTAKLLVKLAAFRQGNGSWNNKKTAAELCRELSVTVGNDTYADWFLPSQEELIEIFKKKAILQSNGADMPANNYWSSSEGDGDAAGWSAYYVNFYESVNIVSSNSDKEGWQIGVRAVRAF